MIKKLLLVLALVVAVMCGALWSTRNSLADRALEALKHFAAEDGLVISYEDRDFNLVSLTLKNLRVDGLVKRTPISVRVDELLLSPRWTRVLSGELGAELQARMYRGQVFLTAWTPWDVTTLNLSGKIDRLELSDYPLIRATGISRGQLSLDVPAFRLSSTGNAGSFTAELIRLGKDTPTEIKNLLPSPISIPAFERINLAIRGGLTPDALILRPVDLNSDFGTLMGNFALGLGLSRKLEGQAQASLTPVGQQLLGPWLPVAR